MILDDTKSCRSDVIYFFFKYLFMLKWFDSSLLLIKQGGNHLVCHGLHQCVKIPFIQRFIEWGLSPAHWQSSTQKS